MSWEAVTWANKQRMKLPHEQLILLVLANCADPDGVAFAQWRGREHWWTYLVEKTRMSKSSLFRHMNRLVELGLCERTMVVLQDGARRPIVRLNFLMLFDIDEHDESQSHGDTGSEDDVLDAENVSDHSGLDDAFGDVPAQSHGGTGPTGGNGAENSIPMGGNEPFPIVGMQESSKSDSKSRFSPLPPSGGPSAVDELWDQFVKAWASPIQKMALARAGWDRIATDKRGEVIAASKGYWAWVKAHPKNKEPTPQSAQSFLRDVAGWAQWLRYLPEDDGTPVSIARSYALNTTEGLAIVAAYEISGCQQALRSFMIRGGMVNYLKPITARLRALATVGRDRDAWVVLNHQQAAAWDGFLGEFVTVRLRNRLREGSRAPWPWPPGGDGKIYTATALPVKGQLDVSEFR
jgi:hypothetical protein